MIDENFNENLGGDDFDIDSLDNRDEYRKHPAVSNSDLRYLYNPTTFRDYKAGLLPQSPPKPHQILGQAFEDMLDMTTEEFNAKYLILDEVVDTPSSSNQVQFAEMVSIAIRSNNNQPILDETLDNIRQECYSGKTKPGDGRKLFDSLKKHIDLLTEDRIILSKDDGYKLSRMKANLFQYQPYQDIFDNPDLKVIKQPEFGVKQSISFNGINWKGKLDYLVLDEKNKRGYIIDLKTTSSTIYGFLWDIKKYKYYRQLYIYKMLVQLSKLYPGYIFDTYILACQTSYDYDCKLIPVPNEVLNEAVEEIDEACKKISFYVKTNYTVYYEDTCAGFLPDWSNIFDIEKQTFQKQNDTSTAVRGRMAFSVKG